MHLFMLYFSFLVSISNSLKSPKTTANNNSNMQKQMGHMVLWDIILDSRGNKSNIYSELCTESEKADKQQSQS